MVKSTTASRAFRSSATVCSACLCLIAALAHAEPGAVGLATQRLELMRDVAAYKWINRLPIEDAEREAIVMQNAADAALRHGIEISGIRELFRTQILAAKEVQQYWFDRWAAGDAPVTARDLEVALRPQLLALGEQILASLVQQGCCAVDTGTALNVEGLSAGSRSALLRALASVTPYASRLDQVLRARVLRIGTTGDYPPFSHLVGGSDQLVGIDVDLARDLAASLDAQPKFVMTSWLTLMDDLAAGRFDIAMSGVSHTLARQRTGYFSQPYHVGGKTAIARCDERAQFESLAGIDREGVRVIVNPGGTNEVFVDENLQQAQKVVHEDNRSIFTKIVDGTADVMITDRIEVMLQARIHHGVLCATMADNLTYQEKAYLLPQDEPWRSYVDGWLSERRADGVVQAAFARHIQNVEGVP